MSLVIADSSISGPCTQPFAPPSCQTEVEVRTRRECVPTTENVCTKRTVYSNKVVYEEVCKDVVTYKCDHIPILPPTEKDPNRHPEPEPEPEPVAHGRRRRHVIPYIAPITYAHTPIKSTCHTVTTKQCSNVPKVIAVPKDTDVCSTVTKEDCKDVPYEINRSKCSLITTCPPGYIIQSNSSGSDLDTGRHQCVEPEFKVGKI